jgi:hypothetical protein
MENKFVFPKNSTICPNLIIYTPSAAARMLGWKSGDKVTFQIDIIENSIIISQKSQPSVLLCKQCKSLVSISEFDKTPTGQIKSTCKHCELELRRLSNNLAKKNYRNTHPQKYKCEIDYNNALACGILNPEPCIVCGAIKTEGHHTNYSKPLDVIWLCRKHHLEEHNKLRGDDLQKRGNYGRQGLG